MQFFQCETREEALLKAIKDFDIPEEDVAIRPGHFGCFHDDDDERGHCDCHETFQPYGWMVFVRDTWPGSEENLPL